jgi:hypothetical protein
VQNGQGIVHRGRVAGLAAAYKGYRRAVMFLSGGDLGARGPGRHPPVDSFS